MAAESLVASLGDRYPLIIFHGDVGTGKTATAEAAADALARAPGHGRVPSRGSRHASAASATSVR